MAASGDAFATALEAVKSGGAGAGDLFWSQAVNRLDFALVLEPEVTAVTALQVHLAVMVAFGDALGAIAPPETAVHYRWPGTLLINGAAAGRVRTALSDSAGGNGVPAFMVTGITLTIHPIAAEGEPGYRPDNTSLWEEGAGEVDRTRLIESVSRHILTWIDTWQADGFGPVHETWCRRAEGREGNVSVAGAATPQGGFLGLDEDGNLLVRAAGETRALSLLDHVERF